jgi:hypothetical protein
MGMLITGVDCTYNYIQEVVFVSTDVIRRMFENNIDGKRIKKDGKNTVDVHNHCVGPYFS